jgi:hypothetical protein
MAASVTAACLIVKLISLCQGLPKTVPIAEKDDKIYHVITNVNEDDPWQSFNRKFDLLFGEDCRDGKGHFQNIRRGRYGMGAVCMYLKGVNTEEPWFLADLAIIKLERICKELEVIKLKYVSHRYIHVD